MNEIKKPEKPMIPTLAELVNESELQKKDNALRLLLNQEPPNEWLLLHPISKTKYLPIARIEFMLSYIFSKWHVEIKQAQLIANSVVVTVRLFVHNKITNKEEWQDGIGAIPIHTRKGAGATDFNQLMTDSVMLAAPHAETAAIKDAAEKFGKIFGKDLNRAENFDYSKILSVEKKESKEDERFSLLIEENESNKVFLEKLKINYEKELSEKNTNKINELLKK